MILLESLKTLRTLETLKYKQRNVGANRCVRPGRHTAKIGQTHRSAPTDAEKHKRNKNKLYMKKVYNAPLATEVNVEASHMLAASLKLDGDKYVNTESGQLSNSHRGEWGNLWK